MACPAPSCAVQVLLMEGVHEVAAAAFVAEGFNVVQHVKLTAAQLVVELADTHIIGIRSKTVLTADVLDKVTPTHTRPARVRCLAPPPITPEHPCPPESSCLTAYCWHWQGVVIAFKASR
jgi:hypothetical protein